MLLSNARTWSPPLLFDLLVTVQRQHVLHRRIGLVYGLSFRDQRCQTLQQLLTLPPWYHTCQQLLPEVHEGQVRRI